jgi:hypothetical protein
MDAHDHLVKTIWEMSAAQDERLREIEARREELRDARKAIENADANRLIYDVLIDDRSSMAYCSKEESIWYSTTGLENAVRIAEQRFERRYGNIRTDGWVRYRVTVRFGAVEVRLPHEAYQQLTKQSLESLQKADKQ